MSSPSARRITSLLSAEDDPARYWSFLGPVTFPPPTLEDLTEEGYGRVSIQEDSPVIPLDRAFTAVFDATTRPADYWLLPPQGSEAVWLPKEALSGHEVGEVHAELIVNSEDVESTGIYALAAKNVSGSPIGWTPFGISVDGESIQPGDPGVNAECGSGR